MAKARALKFYSSDWRGTKWIELTFTTSLWKTQDIPGVYVIYVDKRIVYVGQTLNIHKRLLSYKFRYSYTGSIITPWGFCKKLKIKIQYSSKFGDWAMKELRLINRFQPIHNCVGSVKKRKHG